MDEEKGFIVIQPWMIDLGLSGNDLIVFALINGFSMDGKSKFNGGIEYLCRLTGASRRTAINCLNRLSEMGLIDKTETFKNGIKFSCFSVNKDGCKKCTSEKITPVKNVHSGSENFARGVVKKLHSGSEKIAPNNKRKEKDKVKVKEKSSSRASRLPQDWVASPENISFCQNQRPDLDPYEVEKRFRDYWIAKAGHDASKTDWDATWRNWVRNERFRSNIPTKIQSADELVLESSRLIFGDNYATRTAP